jgi:hypothetical protein
MSELEDVIDSTAGLLGVFGMMFLLWCAMCAVWMLACSN